MYFLHCVIAYDFIKRNKQLELVSYTKTKISDNT